MCVNYLFHLSVYSFVLKSLITLSLSGIVLQMNAVSILFSFPGPCQLSLHKQCVAQRYSSSAHQHVQPIWTLFINRSMSLKPCAVQDKCLRYSVHTVFTVYGPLPLSVGLCFNSGSALFQCNGSLPDLCKKQGVKSQPSKFHSHAPHLPLSTLTFTTRQLPIRPRIKYGGHSNQTTLMTCWRRYLLASC